MSVLQDVVRRWKETHSNFDNFAEKVAFQLNDTHPTIAVPELMRVLMDENQLGWSTAWNITSKVSMLSCPVTCTAFAWSLLGSTHAHAKQAASSLWQLQVHPSAAGWELPRRGTWLSLLPVEGVCLQRLDSAACASML